jgi:hypothetical protein
VYDTQGNLIFVDGDIRKHNSEAKSLKEFSSFKAYLGKY